MVENNTPHCPDCWFHDEARRELTPVNTAPEPLSGKPSPEEWAAVASNVMDQMMPDETPVEGGPFISDEQVSEMIADFGKEPLSGKGLEQNEGGLGTAVQESIACPKCSGCRMIPAGTIRGCWISCDRCKGMGRISPEPTGIEAMVCRDIAARQQMGIKKYGRTVAESGDDWIRHAYEEALDLAVYLRAEMERRGA